MMVIVILISGCVKKDIPAYLDPELPVDERVENLLSLLTLEEKASFLTGKDMWHFKGVDRLGIPSIQVTDCGHGVTVVLDGEGNVVVRSGDRVTVVGRVLYGATSGIPWQLYN